MILPIVAYGDPVLKKKAEVIPREYPNLKELLESMFETMYNANGVGLAAPQVGLPIRVFVMDVTPFAEEEDLSPEEQEALKGLKKVIINPTVVGESGEEWAFTEGCLSIPDIQEDVLRKDTLEISYVDENFESHTETYSGLAARVMQHEYDHLEGILFTDKLSSFKKRLIKGKLSNITKGKIQETYRMRFPGAKKIR